jgi:hypothetical protein
VTLHVDEPAVDAHGTVRVLGNTAVRPKARSQNELGVRRCRLGAQLVGTLERSTYAPLPQSAFRIFHRRR